MDRHKQGSIIRINESRVSGGLRTNKRGAVCLVCEQVSGGVLALDLSLEVGQQLLSIAVSCLLAGGFSTAQVRDHGEN